MTDAIRAAQAVLQAEAEKLTTELRAKGYPKCHVEIWINRDGNGKCAVVDTAVYPAKDSPVPFIKYSADVVAVIAECRAAIATVPVQHDPSAYAPYFAWPQAEAAE